MTRAMDGLVERACRRDELLQVACHESRALQHPERPARASVATPGVYLCCVVAPVPGVDGCPVCGCHESYRGN